VGCRAGQRIGFQVSRWWRWSRPPPAVELGLGFEFSGGSSVHQTMKAGGGGGVGGPPRKGGGGAVAPLGGQGRMVGGSVTGGEGVRRRSG
jgi:hypothetical protein